MIAKWGNSILVVGYFFLAFCVRAADELQPCSPIATNTTQTAPLNVEYILVVDSTGSMNNKVGAVWNLTGPTRWDELREQLVASVSAIPMGSEQRLNLLVFGGSVSPTLQWNDLAPQTTNLVGNRTTAVTVEIRTEAERDRVIALIRAHKPNAGQTALNDAIGAAYDRAVALHAENPSRQILIAVFSDGADNSSTRFPRGNRQKLEDYIRSSEAQLGASLVNVHYFYVRVAGLSMPPPTSTAIVIDRTPTLANFSLRPEKSGVEAIDAGTLAGNKEETGFVNVVFDLHGLKNKVFPVFFDPLPTGVGKPQVAVICEGGAKAAFGESGVYRIKFRRMGPAADYERAFEGNLRLDLGQYAYSSVDGVRLSQISQDVKVRFAGLTPAATPSISAFPGTRVLVGTSLKLETEPRADAKYVWSFSGADSGTAEGFVVTRVFRQPGQVKAELTVTQPGFANATVSINITVVDPQFRFSVTPANPVEGEKVQVALESGPGIKISNVYWTPQAESNAGSTATYEFSRSGEKELLASVATDLGQAHCSTKIQVAPGVPAPELISPELDRSGAGEPFIVLYKQDEPQRLEAEVGEAVASVRFSLLQGGQEVFSRTSEVAETNNQRISKVDFVYPSALQPGTAQLALIAVPKDPSLTVRLGERKSLYSVLVSKFAFSIERDEPLSSELLWDKDASFVVVMGGEGRKKVSSLEWTLESVGPGGQTIPILSRIQRPDEFPDGNGGFIFNLNSSDPRFQSLRGDSWLRVTAVPQGDQSTIAGQTARWDGLRPKLETPEFVIQAPPQVDLDTKANTAVIDRKNGNRAEAVTWEVVGEEGNPLAGMNATALPFEPRKPGPHVLKATVTWAGGTYKCEDKAFFVGFEPVDVGLNWGGGQKPVITARGKSLGATIPLVSDKPLMGTRASLLVDLRSLTNGKAGASVAGWPKTPTPTELAKGFPIPWPPDPGASLVTVTEIGFNPEGLFATNQIASFQVINRRPVQLWFVLLILGIGLALFLGVIRLISKNEGRYYALVAIADGQDGACLKSTLRKLHGTNTQGNIAGEAVWADLKKTLREEWNTGGVGFFGGVKDTNLMPYWRSSSWLTKELRVDLKSLLPSRAGDTWPEWITSVDNKVCLRFCNDGGICCPDDAVYATDDCTERAKDFSIKKTMTNVLKPADCKQILELSKAGKPVFLLAWDQSEHKEGHRALRLLHWIGYATIMGIIATCFGIIQIALK